MKLQKILNRFQELHKREIDLSLYRIKALCQKLGNVQDKMRVISVVGTNGKFSTIAAMHSILKEANLEEPENYQYSLFDDECEGMCGV